MPLLLASTFASFKNLFDFNQKLSNSKVVCVITAANTSFDKTGLMPKWAVEEIDSVKKNTREFFQYDLVGKNLVDLKNDISDCNIVYFIGGNTYYLLEHVQKSQFKEFIVPFLKNGGSFWGGSAGAVIACPDIDYIRFMDEPEKSNLSSYAGLGLTNYSIMPHWKGKHHQEALKCLNNNSDLDIICLTDEQALYIEGNRIEIL